MKFAAASFAIAVSSFIAVASADMLQIHNPTVGSTWKTDAPNYLGWSGNCSSMGEAGKAVIVDLMAGPANALRFVTNLGTIDCSASSNGRADITVPKDVASGKYSLVVRTAPDVSYTNPFDIVGASGPAPPPTPPPTAPTDQDNKGTPEVPTTGNSASVSFGISSLVAVVGVVSVAAQFL
ncbi:hypothetical protein BG004_000453 [Podila humilis]|nr:hypothetical protein BG004_000453 [Podila humilis]